MKQLFSTREVAKFLGVNEKMVYTLIAEKGLPATKVTGKWLFPTHLVEQWVEGSTMNYPRQAPAPRQEGLLVVAGSNDILLDRTLALFMSRNPETLAVFGNLGSMGGLKALRSGRCHLASSHLAQENGREYNFAYAEQELDQAPAVVNFCRREQGLMTAPGNPKGIQAAADAAQRGLTMVNRALGTGTRLLFDRELRKAGADPSRVKGYDREVGRHLDVGLEVLAGRADMGPGIRSVAGLLGLGFVSLGWERFDLLVSRERFFDKQVQSFLGLLTGAEFRAMAAGLEGYDTEQSGKIVYPGEATEG